MDPITVSLVLGGASLVTNIIAAKEKGEINDREYNDAIRAANEFERALKTLRPDETWQDIKPELLQKAAEYVPDIASFVEENAPQLITEANAAQQKRIQRQALQSYAAKAETGRDVIAEAQREQALFEADARAKQRQQALMDRMKQQGMVGSGAALAAQLQTEQATAQEARQQALRGTQEAEMRRREALGQAASLAGQMRQSELGVESANVQTMNAFNQRLANAKNIYNQYASNVRNQAQLENQRRELERQSANVALTNRYAMYNREQALAAKERARSFDERSLGKMYDIRSGLRTRGAQIEREGVSDKYGAITSALGTGLQGYALASMPAANAAKTVAAKTAAAYAEPATFELTDTVDMGNIDLGTNPSAAPSRNLATSETTIAFPKSGSSFAPTDDIHDENYYINKKLGGR